MKTFRQWLAMQESNARTRAAMNPGIPFAPSMLNVNSATARIMACRKYKKERPKIVGGRITMCDKVDTELRSPKGSKLPPP
jgi:hypothetical protein